MYEDPDASVPLSPGDAVPPAEPGALAMFDTRGLEDLFPKSPPLAEIPPPPIDPRAKWRAFAAGALKGGPRFGTEFANALEGYNAQSAKDAELYQKYLPLALDLKNQRALAQLRQQQEQQKLMQTWNTSLIRATAPLLMQPGQVDPTVLQQTVAGVVGTGQVPQVIAQKFLQQMNPADLRASLTRTAMAATKPFEALATPKVTANVDPEKDIISTDAQGQTTVVRAGGPKLTDFERKMKSEGLVEGTPEWSEALRQFRIKQSTHAPANQQTVVSRGEAENAKAIGKGFGEGYIDLIKGAERADAELDHVGSLGALLKSGLKTHSFAPLWTKITGYTKPLGLDLNPQLGEAQAFLGLSQALALKARNTADGAGMPGALSDSDRQFLVDMVPGLGKDPKANQILLEVIRRLAQRKIEVAELASKFRDENDGVFDGAKFLNYKRNYFKDRHMFNGPPFTRGAAAPGPATASGAPSTADLVKGAGITK